MLKAVSQQQIAQEQVVKLRIFNFSLRKKVWNVSLYDKDNHTGFGFSNLQGTPPAEAVILQ